MTDHPPTLTPSRPGPPPAMDEPDPGGAALRRRTRWRGFSGLQLAVLAGPTALVVGVAGAIAARTVGLIDTETMIAVALALGEDGGTLTFAAMLLASPVQWITGRSQVRVRKWLGILFFALAVSNGAMFVVESGFLAAFGAPFLVAGTIALLLSVPLFATSTRWSQRALGRRRWKALHRLTYVVAVALVAHLVLAGEPDIGATLIVVALALRLPPIRRRLLAVGSWWAARRAAPLVTA